MPGFQQYRKKQQLAEMRPYELGESVEGLSISDADRANGSPKAGDFIARNPENHADRWLVSAKFVTDNYVAL